MNECISFILGTVMTYFETLMHVKKFFGPIQYGYHTADLGFVSMDLDARSLILNFWSKMVILHKNYTLHMEIIQRPVLRHE